MISMGKRELKKLGLNIKHARKEKRFSQEKLAEKLNVSRNYIGMIERAEVNTPVDTVFKIAKILEINARELFNF